MSHKYTVLIVDDEKTNIDFIVKHLGGIYNFKMASNGMVALKILEKFKIDLILLDIRMPVLDGYETAKRVVANSEFKHIPFIFLTAKSDTESIVYGFELGAKDYITKPFNKKELQVRVKNHLKTYNLIQKLESAYSNLKKFIDSQGNIIFLTDGFHIAFANKKFFHFFGIDNLEEFALKHSDFSKDFIVSDKFFHFGKVGENLSWLDAIVKLPEYQRVVLIKDKQQKEHSFSVTINNYDEEVKIVTLNDISKTIEENQHLEDMAFHDKLTGAYNREFFDQNHMKIVESFSPSKIAIAFLDIDYFKSVNDAYGHSVGDKVLMEFVQVIKSNLRKEDILIRWGGEEFILLFKVDSNENLQKVLEHLRKSVQEHNFAPVGEKTCSIGGTFYKAGEDILFAIGRSDDAVYRAKNTGRNRVVIVE